MILTLLNLVNILTTLIVLLIDTVYLKVFYKNNNTNNLIALLIVDTVVLSIYFVYSQDIWLNSYIFFLLLSLVIFTLFLISVFWQLQAQKYLYNCYITQKSLNAIFVKPLKFVTFEYLFILTLSIFFFPLLWMTRINIITLYVILEIISLLILLLYGFQLTNKSVKGAVIYFYYGFFSTILLLWSIIILYSYYTIDVLILSGKNLNFLVSDNNIVIVYLSILFLLISFFIKLGVFPYHTWVINVYTALTNINFLVSLTLLSANYFLTLISIVQHLIIVLPLIIKNFILLLLVISAVGSTIMGGFLLHTQNSIKGFFAANSIITTGFLVISVSAFFELVNVLDKGLLLWIILLYIFFYNMSIYILLNCWSALLIWQWKHFNKIYLETTNSFILNKVLVKLILPTKLGNLVSKYYFIYHFNYRLYKVKLNYNIKHFTTNFNSLKFNVGTASRKMPQFEHLHLLIRNNYNYITNIWIFNYFYFDFYIYTIIWVLFGFPPFLLFLLKFYLILYIIKAGFLLYLWIILLITNLLITSALCRIITVGLIHFKYNQF